jgi:hypothetical protein
MSDSGPEPPRREGHHAADRLRQFERARYGDEPSPLVPADEADEGEEEAREDDQPGLEGEEGQPDDPAVPRANRDPKPAASQGRD